MSKLVVRKLIALHGSQEQADKFFYLDYLRNQQLQFFEGTQHVISDFSVYRAQLQIPRSDDTCRQIYIYF